MTPKELFTKLRDELRLLDWPSSTNPIFNKNVFVVPEIPIQQLAQFSKPCCFITDTGASNYEQHNGLMEQNFGITIFVENVGDNFGEGVMLSANKISDTSKGAGIFEIEQAVLAVLKEKTSLLAAKIVLKSKSKIKSSIIKSNEPSIFRTLSFSAFVSIDVDPNPNEILRMPGFLYWNPVDLIGNYGTKLGFVETGCIFDPNIQTVLLSSEDHGNEPGLEVFVGAAPAIVADLLNYNESALARMFPGMSNTNKVQIPGILKSGAFLSDEAYSGRLLYVPDDKVNNPCLLIQRASPRLGKFIRVSRGNDMVFQVNFQALRKTDHPDGTFYMGPILSAILR